MDKTYIDTELEGRVLKITLGRPEVKNSFNLRMSLDLQSAIDKAGKDESVRAILLAGKGGVFSAGQDLNEVCIDEGQESDLGEIIASQYIPIILKIRNIEKPFVCAVSGFAAGAGANIAFACDFVVASENAFFVQAFSKIGLIPDSAGTFFLPRLVGLSRATALMMLSEKLTAKDALQMGLIYKTTPEDELHEEALSLAKKLASMPSVGLGLTKRALNVSFSNTLVQQLELEKSLQYMAGNTYDYKEGIRAFLEKRKPSFTGK
jgi:2-(1,2-epoxy-1,2-dihydrophenyl)acetyl-CoA isomerase